LWKLATPAAQPRHFQVSNGFAITLLPRQQHSGPPTSGQQRLVFLNRTYVHAKFRAKPCSREVQVRRGLSLAQSHDRPLIPALRRSSRWREDDVVILKNLAVHRCEKAAECLKRQGAPGSAGLQSGFEPHLASYRKDKRAPARAEARIAGALWRAIGDICNLFEPDKCWN
jgi:hypothetical protein